jgi:hypothetical protein
MSTGIIVRIDWNENKWEEPSENLELAGNFEYVKDNNISYTCFNFAHEIYNPEADGFWYGLIPSFFSKSPDKDKIRNLSIVFIISNYNRVDYIVGLYAFPKIGNKLRKNLIEEYPTYNLINIGAEPKNILRLENYIDLNNINLKKALGNQQISLRGWNYIKKENIGYLFDIIQKQNPEDKKLKQIKLRCLR